jgi:osmotically-inducible protein OsmY
MTRLDENESSLLRAHEDALMEHEINRKLGAITTWDTTDIQAKVKDGLAVLSGTVANTKAMEQTVLVVFTVKGLKKIDNKIRIRKEGIASFVSHAAADIAALTNDNKKDK